MKRIHVVIGVWLAILAWVLAGLTPVSASARESARPSASPAAAASSSAAYVDTEGGFQPLPPTRLLDTRNATGVLSTTPIPSAGTVSLQVTDAGGVPGYGVSAVVLNVTVVAPTGSGYITAYADGASQPNVSNLNFAPTQTVANLVVVPVSDDGKVALFNGSSGTVHLLADVSGYFLAGAPSTPGAFNVLAPERLLDTRTGNGRTGTSAVPSAGVVPLQVTGRGGVPASGVSAVVLNVTVVAPKGSGYITASANGVTRPNASNLNFTPNRTVPNLVVVPVGANGQVDLFNGSDGTVHLLADVSGYFLAGAPTAAGALGALAPGRLLDTRTGNGRPGLTSPVPSGAVVSLQVTNRGGVPASGVSAVVLNLTVVAPTGSGYITAHADQATRPNASNVNFSPNLTVANLVVVPVGINGKVSLFNGSTGTVHLLADVTGWIRAGSAGTGTISGTVTDAGSPNHGLAGVTVSAYSAAQGDYSEATTDTTGAYLLYDLTPDTDYRVCFQTDGPVTGGGTDSAGYLGECYDNVPPGGTPSSVGVTADQPTNGINAALTRAGAISGTVTDAGGTHHGLANVYVYVYSADAEEDTLAITDANGNYTVPGLRAATDYQVCFDPTAGTGGSADAFGYVAQCYNGQPVAGAPTQFTVTLGNTAAGRNAAVAGGGAVSGTVTDANGAHHGLGSVFVDIWSPSLKNGSYAETDANGAYAVKGLPTASDYQVCFYGSDGYGGSTDARGYRDECYDNQTRFAPQPQTFTAGLTRPNVNAALGEAGALSGTVTESGGTQHALGNIYVTVDSAANHESYAAWTDSNGQYMIKGLYGGSDYEVCFHDFGYAYGGAADEDGYQDECYNNQPTSSPQNQTVAPAATLGGIDAALAAKAGATARSAAPAQAQEPPAPPAAHAGPVSPYAAHPEIGHSYPGDPTPDTPPVGMPQPSVGVLSRMR